MYMRRAPIFTEPISPRRRRLATVFEHTPNSRAASSWEISSAAAALVLFSRFVVIRCFQMSGHTIAATRKERPN